MPPQSVSGSLVLALEITDRHGFELERGLLHRQLLHQAPAHFVPLYQYARYVALRMTYGQTTMWTAMN